MTDRLCRLPVLAGAKASSAYVVPIQIKTLEARKRAFAQSISKNHHASIAYPAAAVINSEIHLRRLVAQPQDLAPGK